jgi:hypothetical protein
MSQVNIQHYESLRQLFDAAIDAPLQSETEGKAIQAILSLLTPRNALPFSLQHQQGYPDATLESNTAAPSR